MLSKIHPFLVYSFMNFDIVGNHHNHHHNQDTEHFHYPKYSLIFVVNPLSHP